MDGAEYMMNKELENKHLVEQADKAAEIILKSKGHTYVRDKFFPKMIEALELENGAEIGVDKGGFSCHLLGKSELEMLYCIDPWIDDFGSDHRPGFFNKDGNNRYEEAMDNLNKYQGRFEPIRSFSVKAAVEFENDSLDFCYIDGDHSLDGIYQDMHAWTPKVRVGGIIAGHDYKDGRNSGMTDCFGEQLPFRVKTVTDDFCQKHGYSLREVGGRIMSWWFVKNKEMEAAHVR